MPECRHTGNIYPMNERMSSTEAGAPGPAAHSIRLTGVGGQLLLLHHGDGHGPPGGLENRHDQKGRGWHDCTVVII